MSARVVKRVQIPEKEKVGSRRLDGGLTHALLRELCAEAFHSSNGEAYRELAQEPGYRLGIVAAPRDARTPRYSLVVLIDSPDRTGARGRIRRGPLAEVEAELAARGYHPTRLDYDWMAHERSLAPSRLAAEWRFLQGLLEPEMAPQEGGL